MNYCMNRATLFTLSFCLVSMIGHGQYVIKLTHKTVPSRVLVLEEEMRGQSHGNFILGCSKQGTVIKCSESCFKLLGHSKI